MNSCRKFTRRLIDRDERIDVVKQCASALSVSGQSIQTPTVTRKRTAPLYGDVHSEAPPVSLYILYTLPLILSEPVLSYKEHK